MYNEKETPSLFNPTNGEDSSNSLKELTNWDKFLGIYGIILIAFLVNINSSHYGK
jgi:hypothetical protein